MNAEKNSASIFSQKFDRIVFTTYFLGAVVPLVAMAFISERFVLPTLADRLASAGLIALILSIGSLSLGAFLILRRTTRQALNQMDSDNRRNVVLLTAASAFGNAQYEAEVAATTVRCALELSNADASYAFVRSDRTSPATLVESLGKDAAKKLERIASPIAEMVDLAIREDRTVLRGPGSEAPWKNTSAVVIPLAGESAPMGALVSIRSDTSEGFTPGGVDSLSMLTALSSVSLRNSDLRDAQRNFFAHTTELLVTALDAHLPIQRGHGSRVAQYANRVGRQMILDEDQLHHLHFAALLHDIGMLKLDRAILTDARACEKHTIIGARMLERIRLWKGVAPIVLRHHEWFDGSGYPENASGDAIHIEARIIAVCEAFDVMVSDSSYKVAVSFEEALSELDECAGIQFDPEVVAAFKALAENGAIEAIR